MFKTKLTKNKITIKNQKELIKQQCKTIKNLTKIVSSLEKEVVKAYNSNIDLADSVQVVIDRYNK